MTYTYDGLNQLSREDNAQSGDSIVYEYDTGGNLLTKEYYDYTTGTLGTMLTDYDFGYDNTVWKDQMTDYDGTDLTYDAVGNMTDYGQNLHFTWDKGNQLASVVFDLYNLTVSYKYDQNGMRTQKLMNGNVIMDYTYIGDRLISQTDYLDQTIDFIYDAMGDMIGVKYDGETYFYMRNLQGDVCGIYDSEFEFYYLRSRYYWPALGRFISADSLFMAGNALVGTNMYAYCLNNPIMYFDPTGYASDFGEGFAKFFKALGYMGWLYEIAGWSIDAISKLAELPIDEFIDTAYGIFFKFYEDVFLGGTDPWVDAGYVYFPGLGYISPEEHDELVAILAIMSFSAGGLGYGLGEVAGMIAQGISVIISIISLA